MSAPQKFETLQLHAGYVLLFLQVALLCKRADTG